MVTIKEIAQRAGVSTATVSNVIHGKSRHVSVETVKRIQALIDEMGYEREAGKRVRSSDNAKLVAIIIRYHQGFENSVLADPFYGVVTGSIEQELRSRGLYLMLYASSNMDDIFRMLMTWDVDGVIAVSFTKEDCQKLQSLIQKPMISIDAFGPDDLAAGIPDVGLEDETGGLLMTRHLLDLGYETIFVAGVSNTGIDNRRWSGAKQATNSEQFLNGKHKLEFIELGGTLDLREKCYQQITRHLPFRKKTAFFFTSDSLAMEAISYFAKRGITVPDSFGVAGFDDSINAVSFSIPPLTTIHQDVPMKARIAVEELVSAIRDPNYIPKSHKLPVTLISRKSV